VTEKFASLPVKEDTHEKSHFTNILTIVVLLSLQYNGTSDAGRLGDVDNDGKVGLTEAVHAIQVASGVQAGVPASYVMVWRSSWKADEAYNVYDAVQRNGSSYICIQSHTSMESNGPPDTNMWNVLALQGEQGPQGPMGDTGGRGSGGHTGGSDWSMSGSHMYFTEGNVGIGTTEPTEKLDVHGRINATEAYMIGGMIAFTAEGENTFVGIHSGNPSASGTHNTFLGKEAGYWKNEGDNNTYVGHRAGFDSGSAHGNVFVGYHAGYNEKGSNRLYIANSESDDPLIYGEFDKNTVQINDVLRLKPRMTEPTNPVVGTMYIDANDSNKLKVWDGAAWRACW